MRRMDHRVRVQEPGPRGAPAEDVKRAESALEELLADDLLQIKGFLEVDTVAVLLLDEHEEMLVARAASGLEEEVEQGVRIPVGKGFAGRVAATRAPVMIEDVEHADVLDPLLREKGIKSMLGVPLTVGDKLLGVVHVGSLTPRTFGDRDIAMLEASRGVSRSQSSRRLCMARSASHACSWSRLGRNSHFSPRRARSSARRSTTRRR